MPHSVLDAGISFILFLQGLGTWLAAPMQFFSLLGTEEFFLFAAPAIFWCLDATLGIRVGLFLMISSGLNFSLKLAFHDPRPYWYDTRVRALSTETSFGIPSGHSQHAAVVWGTLAEAIRRRWAWAAAILLIFFIGTSRMVLGVHFPTDVLAGWLIGGLLLWAFLKLEGPVTNWLKRSGLAGQISAALILSLALIALGALVKLSLGSWTIPEVWIQNAAAAAPDAPPIEPLAFSGLVSNGGAFFGLALGYILLIRQGGFDARGLWWKRLARFLIGLAGVAALWFGLGSVFPRGEYLLSYLLRYLRYGLVGIWVTGLGPLLFVRLGLANKTSTAWANSSTMDAFQGNENPSEKEGSIR